MFCSKNNEEHLWLGGSKKWPFGRCKQPTETLTHQTHFQFVWLPRIPPLFFFLCKIPLIISLRFIALPIHFLLPLKSSLVSFYTFFFPSFLFLIYVSSQSSPPANIVTPFSQEKFKETNLSFPFAKTKHKHKLFLLLKHFTEIRFKLHFYVQL